jgi:hypothetical protein
VHGTSQYKILQPTKKPRKNPTQQGGRKNTKKILTFWSHKNAHHCGLHNRAGMVKNDLRWFSKPEEKPSLLFNRLSHWSVHILIYPTCYVLLFIYYHD